MNGDLEDFGLAELLQVLSMGRRSGVLELQGDRRSGRIVLQSGGVVDASAFGAERGEAAFFELLANRSGPFSFRAREGVDAPTITISRSLNSLLIEAALQGEE